MIGTKANSVASHDAARQADGRIRGAIQRVAGKYPFHAKVLERFIVRPRPSVSTMGVTVSGDDVLLLHNPAFVLSIRLDELVGVLLHEVHHVVFGHVLADPADFPDSWARVVAEEVTVNEFVTEPLPLVPVLLSQYPGLPPRESTRRRYRRLARHAARTPIAGVPGATPAPAPGVGTGAGAGAVVDDHSVWREAAADPQRAGAALRAAVHDAAIDVGAGAVPGYLRGVLAAMGVGRLAGDGTYELAGGGGGGAGCLPWARLLRRYAGQHLRARPDFRRPPRRCPGLVWVVPGRGRLGDLPRVMAVIDTSGSVTPDLLEQISGELARLAGSFAVTVVECDAAVHAVYPYRPLTTVHGRGGTDLRPPLEPSFLRGHRPDLVVYFTDGWGPAPACPPRVPVVWCLTPSGTEPADWGRVIRMSPGG